MRIKITVFRQTGKYYTSCIVGGDRDIPLFEEEFTQFVTENLPADLGEGYVLVQDAEDADSSQSFHIRLYRREEITGRKTGRYAE